MRLTAIIPAAVMMAGMALEGWAQVAAAAPPAHYVSPQQQAAAKPVATKHHHRARRHYRQQTVVVKKRPFSHSAAIVGGSAAGGALIGGLAGGGKGAAIGALAGGGGGLIYDRATAKKKVVVTNEFSGGVPLLHAARARTRQRERYEGLLARHSFLFHRTENRVLDSVGIDVSAARLDLFLERTPKAQLTWGKRVAADAHGRSIGTAG